MISSTVTTPKTGVPTLVGLDAVSSIDQPDRPGFRAALKRTKALHTHEFVHYRVGPYPYIGVMVPCNDIIVVAELPDTLDRDRQKEVLVSSIKGLLPAMA